MDEILIALIIFVGFPGLILSYKFAVKYLQFREKELELREKELRLREEETELQRQELGFKLGMLAAKEEHKEE